MDIKGKRITGGILAVLAATVVACGSANAGSASHERGGGSAYITADDQYGVGLRNTSQTGIGAAGTLGDALGGPQLQP